MNHTTRAQRINARQDKIWAEAMAARRPSVLQAAKKLLERLDNITTDEFSKGGERDEREALRLAIAAEEAA